MLSENQEGATHRKPLVWIVVIVVVLAVIGIIGWYLVKHNHESKSVSLLTTPASSTASTAPDTTYNFPTEPLDATSTDMGVTFAQSIYWDNAYITLSADPKQFPAGALVAPHASTPTPIQLASDVGPFKKGDILVYFVDAQRLNGGVAALSMVASHDNGKTWGSSKYLVQIQGMTNKSGAVDPTIVQLPNGNLRLYFFGPDVTGNVDPGHQTTPHVVYSATTTDGVNFAVESGQRFSAAQLTDPEVIYRDNQWYMYYSVISNTQLATSSDGLTFTGVPMPPNGIGGVPGALALNDGVRLYGCTQTGIATGFSPDGIRFTRDNSDAVSGGLCDPSPIQLADGQYLMIYKKHEAPATSQQNQPLEPPPNQQDQPVRPPQPQ